MQIHNEKSPCRTLKSLDEDLARFESSGNILKNAKLFNNVIDKRLFNVPITQVNGIN